MNRVLALTLILSTATCASSDSVVVVNVTTEEAALPVTRLRLSLSNGAVKDTKLFPDAGDASTVVLMWPATLALVLPHARGGSLDLAVDGLDAGGVVVAAGSAQTIIVVGGRTTVSLALARHSGACGDGKMGPTEECDDGNRFSGDGCSFVCLREGTGGGADAPGGTPIDGRGSDVFAGGGGRTSGGGGGYGGSPAIMSTGGTGGVPVGVPGFGGTPVVAQGGPDAAATLDSSPVSFDTVAPVDTESVDTAPAALSQGSACSADRQCRSGFCVDGVCCNEECRGACRTCARMPGVCRDIMSTATSAEDPDNECGLYYCASGPVGCSTTCSTDTGCRPGYYCDRRPTAALGACVRSNLAPGTPCERDRQCGNPADPRSSFYCVGDPLIGTTRMCSSADHKYTYISNAGTWAAARDACVRLGMALVTIETATENTWVTQFGVPKGKFWIGLYRESQQTPHRWASGSMATYRNWNKASYPNPIDNCTNMYYWLAGSPYDKWASEDCSQNLGAVCEGQ